MVRFHAAYWGAGSRWRLNPDEAAGRRLTHRSDPFDDRGRPRSRSTVALALAVSSALAFAVGHVAIAGALVVPSIEPCAVPRDGLVLPQGRDLAGNALAVAVDYVRTEARPDSASGVARPGGQPGAAAPSSHPADWEPMGAVWAGRGPGAGLLALVRLSVPPGGIASLSHRTGSTALTVETGSLTAAVERGSVHVVPAPDEPAEPLGAGGRTEVAAGGWLAVGPGAALTLRNEGVGSTVAVAATFGPPPLAIEPRGR